MNLMKNKLEQKVLIQKKFIKKVLDYNFIKYSRKFYNTISHLRILFNYFFL